MKPTRTWTQNIELTLYGLIKRHNFLIERILCLSRYTCDLQCTFILSYGKFVHFCMKTIREYTQCLSFVANAPIIVNIANVQNCDRLIERHVER